MTNSKRFLRGIVLAASVLGVSFASQGAVTLQYTDSGTFAQTGFTDNSYGSGINSSDLIGIYKFNTSGGSVPNPFYSVCLSPAGMLDRNSHTYDILPFSQANPGTFPSSWAWGLKNNAPQYWGIQNASYLWNTFGMNIVNNTGNLGDQTDRATALQFAIWSTLYNSTAYGAATDGLHWAKPSNLGSGAGSIGSYYTSYLAALNATGGIIPLYTGNILRGQDYMQAGQQQEFLILGTPVPEPSTLLAGALLLLPLGASTLRFFRKKRLPKHNANDFVPDMLVPIAITDVPSGDRCRMLDV